MKKLFISIISMLYIFLIGQPINNINVFALESNLPISINQSVDEDLEAFNFDYEKYLVNPDLVYRLIVINYNESSSKDYMDLIYIYNPNNFNLKQINYNVSYGNTESCDELSLSYYKDIFYAGRSSDGKITRYAINGYTEDRNNYNYRLYTINSVSSIIQLGKIELNIPYSIECSYLFNNTNEFSYSNCMNIYLENPKNWAYYFDEDSSWLENLKDWYISSDICTDYLFYSFYIPDKWDVKNIKSIDIQYKKSLLHAYTGAYSDKSVGRGYFDNPNHKDYAPKFYKWEDRFENNKITKIPKDSEFLGNSIKEIGNKIDFTKKTINPDRVESSGRNHKYIWNKIQNLEAFKTAFGVNSEIYKYASQFMTNGVSKNYWIITYDTFYHFYSYFREVDWLWEKPDDFDTFLQFYQNPDGSPNASSANRDGYEFIREYTFDISAKSITYEESDCSERTLPVSVSPVFDLSFSGEENFSPFDELKRDLGNKDYKKIIKIILLILALILLIPIIVPVFRLILPFIKVVFNVIIKVITLPFKLIGKLFKKEE